MEGKARMKVLAEVAGKVYGTVSIAAPGDFSSPFAEPFVCMIWDHDGRFTDADRAVVAERLLAAGCLYVVCGGRNCEAWHDAMDEEEVAGEVLRADGVDDHPLVMTTWHEGEDPDEVASFFVFSTNFADHEFRQYLVLQVGKGGAKEGVDAAVQRHVRRERGR